MLDTISAVLFTLVMAGFASASIYFFAKSKDKLERLSYAFFSIAFLLSVFDTLNGEDASWLTLIIIVLGVAAIIIRQKADARRDQSERMQTK